MAERVARKEMPGIVMGVAHGNDAPWVDAIGTFGFERTEPMRRDTLFRIASMTKPVVAAAAMMLVDEGRIALDEPVERILPELANRRVLRRIDGPLEDTVPAQRPITIEDLLTFRLGFGQLMEPTMDPPFPIVDAPKEMDLVLGPPDPRTPHAPDEWMRRFGTLPLMAQPGERWIYNVGSLLLGVLVARAAGESLAALLKTRIFEPLGMRDTGFSTSDDKTRRIPSYYMTDFTTGEMKPQPHSAPDLWTTPPVFPSAAAGLLSTLDDYLQFARMLLNHGMHDGKRLLSEQSVQRMTRNHLTPEQIAGSGPILDGSGWGLGMGVSVAPETLGRYGWYGGYGTTWFNDPRRNVIGVGLTQTSDFLWNGGRKEFAQLAGEA